LEDEKTDGKEELKAEKNSFIGSICYISPGEIDCARLNPTMWVCHTEFNWASLSCCA
jgi:hypothetical protein